MTIKQKGAKAVAEKKAADAVVLFIGKAKSTPMPREDALKEARETYEDEAGLVDVRVETMTGEVLLDLPAKDDKPKAKKAEPKKVEAKPEPKVKAEPKTEAKPEPKAKAEPKVEAKPEPKEKPVKQRKRPDHKNDPIKDKLIEMVQRKQGITRAEMLDTTGWQQVTPLAYFTAIGKAIGKELKVIDREDDGKKRKAYHLA
jgi:outer membrane biosynthesis protein TonB